METRADRPEIVASVLAVVVAGYFAWFAWSVTGRDALVADAVYLRNTALLAMLGLSLVGAAFQRSRRRAAFAGGGLMAGCLALVLSATDFYLMTFRFDSSGPGSELNISHRNWWDTFVQKNEDNFWERKVHPYYAYLPTDKYVIAAVGDSFTFGQGLHGMGDRFSNQIEKSLQASFGNRVDVLNYGLGNGDTRTETAFVRDFVSRVHADLAIVFYLSNDIVEVPVVTGRSRPMRPVEKWGLIASPTFNYLYWYFVGPSLYAQMGNAYFTNLLMAYRDPERMPAHLADVATLFDTIKKIGAKPAMVILPFPHMWSNVNPEVQEEIYQQVSSVAAAAGAPVLNLAGLEAELPIGRFEVNAIDGHPNAAAHKAIADRVTQWLLSQQELRGEIQRATAPVTAGQ